ncbi:MAG: biotin--[acetyl-CoA-carboxylase] ligase [Bacteroidota bacterium]
MLLDTLGDYLRTRRLGHVARGFATLASTMDEAAAWAADGAPHGALVTAEAQTAGRGRHGRTWHGTPGANLHLTLVLRPRLARRRWGLLAIAAGLGVLDGTALHLPATGGRLSLKWPNDVLLHRKKLAGVLVETRSDAALLGIGVNVNEAAFPDPLADRATSLRLALGGNAGDTEAGNTESIDRTALLASVLLALETRLDALDADAAGVLADAERRLAGLDGAVTVRAPDGTALHTGLVLGLAPDGGLRLDTGTGEVVVHAGEVTLSGV